MLRLLLHAHSHDRLLLLHSHHARLLLAHHRRLLMSHAHTHGTARLLLCYHTRLLGSYTLGALRDDIVLPAIDVVGADHILHVRIEFLQLIIVELTVGAESDKHVFNSLFELETSHCLLLRGTIVWLDLRSLTLHRHLVVSTRMSDNYIIEHFLLHLYYSENYYFKILIKSELRIKDLKKIA